MSLSRDFYKKFVNNMRPNDSKVDDVIRASQEFKGLLETPGWRRLEKFMETQRQGTQQYMQKEAGVISAFSLPWLFNTFVKYLGVMLENRAYNRIETYIQVTISRGEQYAEKRVKEEEKIKKNEQQ